MNGREIVAALHDGRTVVSSAMVSPSPLWPAQVKQLGLDFVFIDTEHIPIDRQTLAWICQAYLAHGLPSVVRLPSCDPFEACKALDAGAGGVIGPYVETVAQVEGLVGAVKLKPLKGRRLAEALRDRGTLEAELAAYMDQRNGDKILIVNIESVPAIENLHSICSVPGLDAILIGPHDLSCSLGVPEQYEHPRFNEAVQSIFRIAREHAVGAGIHHSLSIERELEFARWGANLFMHNADMNLLSRTLKAEIAQLRAGIAEL
jgi:4-hydroxy-2-oxoheptanedioate aldolase